MTILDSAVSEGLRRGFEASAYERCSGSEDPQDRCPKEGDCVCSYVLWRKLPWWKRMSTEAPPRPRQEDAMSFAIGLRVEEVLEDMRDERTNRP